MDCLVTKLKGSVNDDTLLKLGEFRIKFDMSTDVVSDGTHTHGYITTNSVHGTSGFTVSVIGNGYIGTSDSDVTSKSINVEDYTSIYISDDVEELSLSNKYNIRFLSIRYCRDAIFNIEDLEYSHLISCELYSKGIYGDVTNLFKYTDTFVGKSTFVLDANSSANERLYGDITETLKRIATANPYGFLNLNLDVPNVSGTIKGIVSDNYLLGSDCGDITLDLTGLDFSGRNVSVNCDTLEGNGKARVIGDISSLMSASSIIRFTLYLQEHGQLSGDFPTIFNGRFTSKTIKIGKIKMTTVQDLSKFNVPSLTIFSNLSSSQDWHTPCIWTKNGYQGQYIFALESIWMQSGTEDMLVDLSTKSVNPNATQAYEKVLNIKALDLSAPTENITSAISTLSSKGITVSIEYYGSSTASLSRAKAMPKYAIVYKDKDLIVEPTDLNRATVSAAHDCTYKEFDTIEEAQSFVSSNGLVKVESK